MKKKIGLVTLYKDNYGSILQCYSTKTYINELGFECDLITEQKCKTNGFTKLKRSIVHVYNSVIYEDYLESKIKMRRAKKMERSYLTNGTRDKMNKFIQKYLYPINLNENERKQVGKSSLYYKFIVGSDQVWNFANDIPDYYYLDFTSPEKKIAFSVSIGISNIPNYCKKKIKKYIAEFNEISVREEKAIEILKEIYKGPIFQLGDPTLLYDSNWWREKISKMIDSSFGENKEKFIMMHFLNAPLKTTIQLVVKYAIEIECKIYVVGYWHEIYEDFSDIILKESSPFEYLWMIDNAEAIFSDSFHTTLFSINFEKQFYVFNREYLHNYTQMSRIHSVLYKTHLEDRLIKCWDDFKNVKSVVENGILEKQGDVTRKYLADRLSINIP